MNGSLIVVILVLGLCAGLTLGGSGEAAQAGDKHPVVVLETSMGEIAIELDAEKAPITVENFLKYVDEKFYDDLIFHRVISGFMIQGGGFDAGMNQKRATHGPIRNEHGNGLQNVKGAIAMARTSDPNSATCQFFINHKDNPFLDQGAGYAVFGKVTSGLDVVDKIASVQTGDRAGMGDVPLETVTIKSVRRKAK